MYPWGIHPPLLNFILKLHLFHSNSISSLPTLGRRFWLGLASVVIGVNGLVGLPALQLGPDDSGDWSWAAADETWVLSGEGSLQAYAAGNKPWSKQGKADRFAYLVVAATPQSNIDPFDVRVTNDGEVLSIFDSGFGNPPLANSNGLPSHGIYGTWFEVYQFNFDGPKIRIGNTQPGNTGRASGYVESFDISILSSHPGLTGLHIDLFTVVGNGVYDPGSTKNKNLIKRFAPFSHDAYIDVGRPVYVADAGANWLYIASPICLLLLALRKRAVRST